MVITEVRIKLVENNSERLLAFCSVTFDNAFVVRDLKIIEGQRGMFVAMPSRKLTDRCTALLVQEPPPGPVLQSCGGKLDEARGMRDMDGRAKLHADIAHPIHSGGREQIQGAVSRRTWRRRNGPRCRATSAPTTNTTPGITKTCRAATATSSKPTARTTRQRAARTWPRRAYPRKCRRNFHRRAAPVMGRVSVIFITRVMTDPARQIISLPTASSRIERTPRGR